LTGDLGLGSGGGGQATATIPIHSIVDFGANYENITVSMTASGGVGSFFAGDDSDASGGSWSTFNGLLDGVNINEGTLTSGDAFTPGKRWFALGHGASNSVTITINSTESFTSYTKAGYNFNTPVVHGSAASGSATTIAADGTASFGGNITASTTPTDDAHLVNKLYADNLVAGVDLSGIATNTAAIAAETTARTNADTALSGRLDSLEADPTTQTLLDAETAARTAADTSEANARAAADALLMPIAGGTFTGAISGPAPTSDLHLATKKYADDLVANVDLSQVETNRLDIAAETTARTNADTALSGRLDSLEADPTTQTLLDAETASRTAADTAETNARTSADTALSGRLDTLEADPTTATALSTETAARIAGDALKLDLAGGTMTGAINLGAGSSTYTSNAAATADSTGFLTSFIFNGTVSETVNFKFNSPSTAHYVSFEPLTVTSSLRVHVDTNTSGISLNLDQGAANTVNFTENNGDTENDGAAWVTLPVTTPFTLTSIGRDAGHSSWFELGSIEVDGVLIAEGVTVGGGAASVIGVDGTASFGGNVTASAVPTANDHLVNKLYADNLVAGVDLSGIATNAAAIEALTNGAPELLNTLNELADAIGDDENFATTVTGQISAEATTRANADTALSGRLDTLEADPTTQSLLDAETAARQAADTTETNARTSADTALSGRLDTLEADPTTGAALTAETNARTSADTALSNRLNTLEADPTTQTLLDAETAARTAADTAEANARAAADALLLPLAGGTMTGAVNFGSGGGGGTALGWDTNNFDDSHGGPVDFSNNNRTITTGSIYDGAATTAVLPQTGKYYFELSFTDKNVIVNLSSTQAVSHWSGNTSELDNLHGFHIGNSDAYVASQSPGSYNMYGVANIVNPHINSNPGPYVWGFAYDADAGTFAIYLADMLLHTITDVPTHDYYIHVTSVVANNPITINFAESDFAGTVPTGFASLESGGGGAASVIDVDGSASFGGNVTASAAPTDDAHLVNKLYADSLVAGVDLSGIATNAAAIAAETTARTNADNALSGRLNTLEADPTTQTALTAETVARTNADNALSGRLDTLEADPTTATDLAAEATTRANADTVLSGRLDTLEADPTTQTLLTAEATARANADTLLDGRLDTLEADPTTATALASEATTRANADTALSGRLDTLEADPTTATSVTNAIAVETAARIAADALKLDLAGGTMTGAINFGSGGGASGPSFVAVDNNVTVDGSTITFGNTANWHTAILDRASIPANFTGKYYYELSITNPGTHGVLMIGLNDNQDLTAGEVANAVRFRTNNGEITAFSGQTGTADGFVSDYGANGNVIGVLVDGDNDTISFTVNGTLIAVNGVTAFTLNGVTGNNIENNLFIQAYEDLVVEVNTAPSNIPAGYEAFPGGGGGGGGAASVIGVDGTASFGGAVSASTVPTADAHLVNKLYADNLVAGVDLSGIATNAAAIQALTNGAPELLNTLQELASALGDDANFSTTVTGQIAANEVHIDNAATLSGVAKDSTNLGAFTGSTISDTSNIKAALQALETAIETPSAASQIQTIEQTANGTFHVTFVDSNNGSATAESLFTDSGLTYNPSTDLLSGGSIDMTTLLLDGVEVTATGAELNFLGGLTSAVQTQLDGKVTTGANISALVGDTTAGDVPVDVNGTDNYLFLVIDKANGALTAIDKTFLEAE
jgi:hypothetical protein